MKNFLFFLLFFWFLMGGTCAFVQNSSFPPSNPDILFPAKHKASKVAIKTVKKESPQYTLGKRLFRSNCATCHHKNMVDDLTGPALRGVTQRWDKADLNAWIINSGAFLRSGDRYANALYREWDRKAMPAFNNLTDADIDALLIYIEAK